jgi:hypothetical protein
VQRQYQSLTVLIILAALSTLLTKDANSAAVDEAQLFYGSPAHNHTRRVCTLAGFPGRSQSVRTDKPADITVSFRKFIFHSFKESRGRRGLAPGNRCRSRTAAGNNIQAYGDKNGAAKAEMQSVAAEMQSIAAEMQSIAAEMQSVALILFFFHFTVPLIR